MSQLIYNDIKSIISEVVGSTTPTDLLEGTVVEVSPLQIKIDGNAEYYPSSCFVVPEHLTDRIIDFHLKDDTLPWESEELLFTGRIKVFEALKKDDRVLLLQCQKGQKILVLDRLPK